MKTKLKCIEFDLGMRPLPVDRGDLLCYPVSATKLFITGFNITYEKPRVTLGHLSGKRNLKVVDVLLFCVVK